MTLARILISRSTRTPKNTDDTCSTYLPEEKKKKESRLKELREGRERQRECKEGAYRNEDTGRTSARTEGE